MAMKSLEHMMHGSCAAKVAPKRRPLDRDCKFEHLLFRLEYVEGNAMASAMIANSSCKGQR